MDTTAQLFSSPADVAAIEREVGTILMTAGIVGVGHA
jgi:hypothetical protein